MHDLDRIEHALATKRLSPEVFERCAQDLLSGLYVGLSPVHGGSDWGRDADITGTGDDIPVRVLITSSRSLVGVRKNMRAGIASMKKHEVLVQRIILANPAILRLADREKLVKSAKQAGALLDASDVFDGGFFASRLRRDGHWRAALLGLPSGPVTLSPVAPDLAESPWAFLPLVARADDLALAADPGDVILTGPPGSGKSRLLSELTGIGFVDKDAPLENIADDLRWTLPSTVVVDDAAGAGALVGHLLWLRRTEPDLFTYRLIAVCWPPDVEDLQVLMPSARVYSLDLMEREPLDGLIQSMGITGRLARREILDQAEGRPAWVVTLADLLLRKKDPHSLLSGKALLGEVGRYLRRAGLIPDAIDILAVISALGGAADPELGKLGAELQLSRTGVGTVLRAAARSGLIDVQSGYPAHIHTYAVRPPMLADALVAERAFTVPVPALDLGDLASRWPDRVGELAGAAIRSVLLGAGSARQLAEVLFDDALDSNAVADEIKTDLCLEFMRLDRRAGERVLRLAREFFDQAVASGGVRGADLGPAVSLAARGVWLYQLDAAIDLLLSASLVDHRSGYSRHDDPLRQLEDLIRGFHPEVPRQMGIRQQIAARASCWLGEAPGEPSRRRVTAAVMKTVLGLGIRSTVPDPGKPHELTLIDTIVPAKEIGQVFQEIWPVLRGMLGIDRPELAAAAIDVAAEWLRVGGGYDRPFGHDHPQDRVRAAREIGEALTYELAHCEDLSTGNRARLRSVAVRFGVAVAVGLPGELDIFFTDVEAFTGDWLEAEKVLVDGIRATMDEWVSDGPVNVIARLKDIKAELAYARNQWPDRTMIAAIKLAEIVAAPQEWLQVCIELSFMPEGCKFAERLAHDGALSENVTNSLLAIPGSRADIIEVLLGSEPPPSRVAELAAEALTVNDYRLVQTLMLRGRLSAGRQAALLTQPGPALRATAAAAIFTGRRQREEWSPGELESAWLAALGDLRPRIVPGCPGHDMADLFKYLISHYPDTLTGIISRSLSDAGESHAYEALPGECWDVIHLLPASRKLELRGQFQNQPVRRWLLHSHMVGPDTEWLEELLSTHEISPDEALDCYVGISTDDELPIEALAKLLVPRGIDPERIAALRFYGNWSGNLSSWYQAIISSYEAMARAENLSVRAVAEAGIRIFTTARDQAIRDERTRRIRGSL
jgi:hypothetical protein